MPAKLRLDGLDELKHALKMLPEELTDDGGDIVRYWAQSAGGWIRAAYPKGRTGNLQNGVSVEASYSGFGSRYGVRYVVRNKAPHAHIYEYGTQARHYFTDSGKRHDVGAMPAAPPGRAFVPNMERARARMYQDLVALLIRHGLGVEGDWRVA